MIKLQMYFREPKGGHTMFAQGPQPKSRNESKLPFVRAGYYLGNDHNWVRASAETFSTISSIQTILLSVVPRN